MPDRVELRPFQQAFTDAVIASQGGTRIVVADVHPGSGKTLAALHAANMLWRRGEIDRVAVYVPRLNLCQQFEQDWQRMRGLYDAPVMPSIVHRDNEPPLIRKPSCGYISTYASMQAQPALHLSAVRGGKTLVIFDEAQQLGIDGTDSTKSALIAQSIGDAAHSLFVLSGTPMRADSKPLAFATYLSSETRMVLQPDVLASYAQGVAEGYLRPCVATLANGEALYEHFDGTQEAVVLSDMTSGLQRVLASEGFWRDMVDTTVDRVRLVQQTIHPGMCGLIAASTQEHARDIAAYLARRHPTLKTLVAVSADSAVAHERLRAFRRGGYDILISVRMAYVGYDYKPITVVLVLSDFREDGFLRQLVARGMRMWADAPRDQQILHIIAPDDPAMKVFLDQLQDESMRGMTRRKSPTEGEAKRGSWQRKQAGTVTQAVVTDWREHTMTTSAVNAGTTTQSQFDLAGMMHEVVIQKAEMPKVAAAPDEKSQQELERHIRATIATLARRYDAMQMRTDPSWKYGYATAAYNRTVGGRGVAKEPMQQLEQRLAYFKANMRKG